MRQPSKIHINRAYYNFTLYDDLDKKLEHHSSKFRGTVFDLGCGSSPYKSWIKELGCKYVGVDWKENPTEENYIQANLNEKIDIESECADTVLSISVLEHLNEPQLFLSEANRILKTGGFLVLQVPWQWRIHEAPHDYFRYSPYALKMYLENAHFHEIEIHAINGIFSALALKITYRLRRLIRGKSVLWKMLEHIIIVLSFLILKFANILDRWDYNKLLETSGYFITAKK